MGKELKKSNLILLGDLIDNKEIEKIESWNQSAPEGLSVIEVEGKLDNYEGSIIIKLENLDIIEYIYKCDPTGRKPNYNSIKINGLTLDDSNSIEEYMDICGHISISVITMLYVSGKIGKKKLDYSGYGWIKVKRFNEADYTTIEERYEALKKHHKEETDFLIDKVRELANKL